MKAPDISGRPWLTRAEYERCRSQLAELHRVRDRDLPDLMRDARSFVAGDAAEEIVQIRDDHAVVEARIAHLEQLLDEARVLDDADMPEGVVAPGRVVTVRYARLGRQVDYVVGGDPAQEARSVSAQSPVGRALLGRGAGDVVTVELPGGRTEELHVLAVAA